MILVDKKLTVTIGTTKSEHRLSGMPVNRTLTLRDESGTIFYARTSNNSIKVRFLEPDKNGHLGDAFDVEKTLCLRRPIAAHRFSNVTGRVTVSRIE